MRRARVYPATSKEENLIFLNSPISRVSFPLALSRIKRRWHVARVALLPECPLPVHFLRTDKMYIRVYITVYSHAARVPPTPPLRPGPGLAAAVWRHARARITQVYLVIGRRSVVGRVRCAVRWMTYL